ncbi:hypothetical protein [Dyadobacter aurulentus]|uniref:hypothetical protein n=1 Tax=Dyadobacter sp. UC 10 TaxID=2605428 RepID=UPI0011F3C06C|nr:hypothetical protein [Dyadobacter sp. UC 10]KAA0992839.1 hypothetical protein FXO21_23015 [Dyadobacter sp. UC 10]
MKSPEDHIDDGLRDALKRRFDDFEMKPDPSLKKNIFTELKIWQKDNNFQRNWIIGLTLVLFLTGAFFYRTTRDSVAKQIPSGRLVSVHSKVSTKSGLEEAAVDAKGINTNEVAPAGPVRLVIEKSKAVSLKKVKAELSRSVEATVDLQEADEKSPDELIGTGQAEERTEVILDNDFVLLDNLPAHFNNLEMPVPKPGTAEVSNKERPNITGRGWTILAGVTPVKTFQVLNVISNPGFIYQNFRFPSSASLETLGFKANAGIANNGFEFVVSFSQYKQSVRYEKAGNEFEVVPGSANDAKIRRKFSTIDSDRVLKLAGIGVRKQFVPRAPAFRDFYAVLGTEFSRELTQGSNMVWLNAGIGRQVGIGRNTTLQIGPYLEYGFTKFLSAEGAFQVKPYQVGLSVILKNKFLK